ncbi:MAG: hypothetical protein H8D96_15085 [Desulfobacterales bacterium]|uniref:Uncharacterized protein n=1 Tax=Candidatus Desulfatibia vada TaxID=2841696 RepID=A0A8J6P4C5_9BACT|nr:hypothetical protein [Candidatus Desulfatibia vada]
MALMPEKKSERIKMFILILGSVVFVIVGYFRFIHKKPSAVKARTSSNAPLSQLQVPGVDIKIQQTIRRAQPAAEVFPPAFIRDIFSPVKSSLAEKSPAELRQAAIPLSEMELKGTIVGSGKPLAIINDQFVGTGDWIGEYRVIRIGNKAVLLNSGHHQIELEMIKDE